MTSLKPWWKLDLFEIWKSVRRSCGRRINTVSWQFHFTAPTTCWQVFVNPLQTFPKLIQPQHLKMSPKMSINHCLDHFWNLKKPCNKSFQKVLPTILSAWEWNISEPFQRVKESSNSMPFLLFFFCSENSRQEHPSFCLIVFSFSS